MLLFSLALLQQVATVRLDRPTATPRETFTEITGLVELPDGRLLVADQSEHRLVLLDPVSSRVKPLSRQGAGPREFRAVSNLFSRPGGGAWLADFAQRRVLPIAADASLEDVFPVPASLLLSGVDGKGRFYADRFGTFVNGKAPDSMTVVRWTPPAERYDTLMKRNANWSIRIVRSGEPHLAFAPYDAFAVLANGDVATLDATSYRVTIWRDGKLVMTNVVDWTPVPVTNAEKQAYAEARAGRKRLSLGNGNPRTASPPKDGGERFPLAKPPFVDDDVHASPDGHIWVRLMTAYSDSIPRYDVLDATGHLIGKVLLPARAQVAGFGKGTVYVSVKLRRYPAPKF
jgi:hypothetical protein